MQKDPWDKVQRKLNKKAKKSFKRKIVLLCNSIQVQSQNFQDPFKKTINQCIQWMKRLRNKSLMLSKNHVRKWLIAKYIHLWFQIKIKIFSFRTQEILQSVKAKHYGTTLNPVQKQLPIVQGKWINCKEKPKLSLIVIERSKLKFHLKNLKNQWFPVGQDQRNY